MPIPSWRKYHAAPPPSLAACQPAGSVLVIGGGVAGVQAALDLTQLGLKVYLVEKSAAIGGVMARIDKTFPTNDCSLCILAPKLVEAGRDANIDILTRAEIVSLKNHGVPASDIARALHLAVVSRLVGMIQRQEKNSSLVFSGGVAKTPAIVSLLQEQLGVEVLVPSLSEHTGAIGAALHAKMVSRTTLII